MPALVQPLDAGRSCYTAAVLAAVLMLASMAPGDAQPLPIGVRLDDVQGLEAGEAERLGEALRKSLEQVTGRRAHLDEMGGARCARDTACIADVRSRTGSTDVVLVQLIAAGTRVRLVAERAEHGGLISQRLQADLRRQLDSLHGVAQILFPESPAPPSDVAPIAALAPHEDHAVGTWIARGSVGAGAIAAGFAIALRVSSNGARDRAAEPGADFEAERSQSEAYGLASNLLFGAAAALLSGGLVYLLTD